MVGVSLTNSGKTDDKEQLVGAEASDVLVTVIPLKGESDDNVASAAHEVRRRQASIVFGCLSALCMLGCLVIGTWLLFDFVNRTDRTWRRTCRFRVKPMEQNPDNQIFFDHGGLTAFDDGKNQLLSPSTTVALPKEIQQEVHVDVNNNLETIEVPQIGFTSTIRIIEDFEHNITVIRDFGVNKCFIMPLDRQNIPNPNNLIDTFMAMMSGQFLPDNEVLRKTMKVQTPAMAADEVNAYGPVISGTCPNHIKTFRLVPKTAEELQSRRRRSTNALTYIYSVGQHAFLYDIDH